MPPTPTQCPWRVKKRPHDPSSALENQGRGLGLPLVGGQGLPLEYKANVPQPQHGHAGQPSEGRVAWARTSGSTTWVDRQGQESPGAILLAPESSLPLSVLELCNVPILPRGGRLSQVCATVDCSGDPTRLDLGASENSVCYNPSEAEG